MAELTARMNNLGLNESVHAGGPGGPGPQNPPQQRSAYIPPHMRGKMQQMQQQGPPPPPVNGGGSRWGAPGPGPGPVPNK